MCTSVAISLTRLAIWSCKDQESVTQTLYESPIAAIMNGHKLDGLDMTSLLPYIWGDQMSEVGLAGIESRYVQGYITLEILDENPFLCLFQLLETTCILWLMVPFHL